MLAPNGARPTLRLPYAMQLGTGTFDLLPGLTYSGHKDAWSWGGQYSAAIRLEDEKDITVAELHIIAIIKKAEAHCCIKSIFHLNKRILVGIS